jgi:predicted transcriptional regulator of viral defense system
MPHQNAKVRVAEVAGRQWGRITWAQLRELGVPRKTIAEWMKQGYFDRVLPGVYAVGHRAPSPEGDLAAALLYAGPGAALSHQTAAYWLGLQDAPPRVIHVSTPRRCRSQSGIKVHGRRDVPRIWHRGLTTTTVPQVLLDLAATGSRRALRKALANADYKHLLNLKAVQMVLGHGQAGSTRLRQALVEHEPRLARTKSHLEVAFLELCEAGGLPLPEVNQRLAGWEVDALFRAERIAVELDGHGNHRSPAQIRRDRRKEHALRSAGFLPLRYSDEQLEQGLDVIAELQRVTDYRPGSAPNSSVWP